VGKEHVAQNILSKLNMSMLTILKKDRYKVRKKIERTLPTGQALGMNAT